ncbi:MAG: hypothetical protein AAF799_07395 [Myxococcota bacterium]
MNRPHLPTLFLLSLSAAPLALAGCDKKPESGDKAAKADAKKKPAGKDAGKADAKKADAGKADAKNDDAKKAEPGKADDAPKEVKQAPPEEPTKPPIVYAVGKEVWRVQADGSGAKSMGIEVEVKGDGTGAINTGSNSAAVSADGAHLAYLQDANLYVATLGDDGAKGTALTKMPPAKDDFIVAAEISFTGWSPDGQTLVVFLTEPSYAEEDPLPMPAGAEYGAHVLSASDMKLTRAPHIAGAMDWSPDSKWVVENKHGSAADYSLVAYAIAGGPVENLRSTSDQYGFGQLDVAGSHVAWNASGPDGKFSQVVAAPYAGGDPVPLTEQKGFADIQWPRLSPKGDRVLAQISGTWKLSQGAAAPSALEVPEDSRWDDNDHLLAITPEGLVRMDLEGKKVVLDAKATALIRQ